MREDVCGLQLAQQTEEMRVTFVPVPPTESNKSGEC